MAKKPNQKVAEVPRVSSTSTIPVQSGIPIPEASRTRASIYPWATMGDGDSFFLPGKSKKSFTSTAAAAGKRHGFKSRVADAQEGGVSGCRVWRVESR